MGLFGFGKNKNNNNNNNGGFDNSQGFGSQQQGFGSPQGFDAPISLTKDEEITLQKIDERTEQVNNTIPQLLTLAGLGGAAFLLSYLSKRNSNGQKTEGSRVAVVMDVSGSFRSEFYDETIQSVFERLLPIALQFDDDGDMETWLFSSRAKRVKEVTKDNCFGYVSREILNSKNDDVLWGGTRYAKPMELVFDHFVRKNPSNVPTFVIFVTDGENSDHEETRRLLREYSKYNIFWQFVGVGKASMPFLEELDNMSGRYIDNANFMRVRDINRMSDQDLYRDILKEYPSYLNEAKKKGLI